jgi:hypothetical protein
VPEIICPGRRSIPSLSKILTGTRNEYFESANENWISRAEKEKLPEAVLLGSVLTCARNETSEPYRFDIAELSRDTCRIDIAVAPIKSAIVMTARRRFPRIKEKAIANTAIAAIRHGDTALCKRAPPHTAPPRAIAL